MVEIHVCIIYGGVSDTDMSGMDGGVSDTDMSGMDGDSDYHCLSL